MEVGSFLRFGMENAKRHWLKFFGAIIGGAVALLILAVVGFKINENVGILLVAVGAIGYSFGIFANVIRLASNRTFDFKAFIPDPMVFVNFLVGMILLVVVVGIGFVLLIIPGLILGTMLSLVPSLIIDKKMNFIQAFGESIRLTKGHKMDIFMGMFISNIVVSLLSIPVITVFFTLPMQIFVQVFPYIQLSGIAEAPAQSPATEPPAAPEQSPAS
jgi:hypothetical protein